MYSDERVNIVQLIGGFLFLFTGVAVYVLVRGESLPYIPETWTYRGILSDSVIHFTHQLPTFTHLIAFSLFTAALLGGGRRRSALICLFWLFIETVFEVAQHPLVGGWLLSSVPRGFDNTWLLNHTRVYLLSGIFDPLDLLAAVIAALSAYWIINITRSKKIVFPFHHSQNTSMAMIRGSS